MTESRLQIPLIKNKEFALKFLKKTTDIVNSNDWRNSKELYDILFEKGKEVTAKYGKKVPIIFVILRVLKIIREQCAEVLSGQAELEEKKSNILFAEREIDVPIVARDELSELINEAISELESEIEDAEKNIKESVLRHIDSNDVVLTRGYSEMVLKFLLKAAAKKRQFLVIVMETDPPTGGSAEMAAKLSAAGIHSVLAPERASYALMSKVHKSFFECEAVFSDGRALAQSGVRRICIDAKSHSVPTFLLVPSYCIHPLSSLHLDDGALEESPSNRPYTLCRTEVIPADEITGFVTNLGLMNACQLHTLVRDYFCSDVDVFLSD